MDKFTLHILIAIFIILLIGTNEFLLDRTTISFFLISTWLIGVSIPFFINQNDPQINSFIASAFLSMIYVDMHDLTSGVYFNFTYHLIPLLACGYIFIKAKPLSLKYAIYSGLFNAISLLVLYA